MPGYFDVRLELGTYEANCRTRRPLEPWVLRACKWQHHLEELVKVCSEHVMASLSHHAYSDDSDVLTDPVL